TLPPRRGDALPDPGIATAEPSSLPGHARIRPTSARLPPSLPGAALEEPMTRDKKLSRYFFIALLLGTTFLFFYMIRAFLVPVMLAAIFCTLFHPLFLSLLALLRGRRGFAALLCCFILLLGMILPLYGV